MALFKINKGDSTRLESQKAHEGYAYFTPDDGKFYIDVAGDGTQAAVINQNRIPLNAVKADADAKGNVINETYVSADLNDGNISGEYNQLDADTLGGVLASNYATKAYVSAEIANAQLAGGDDDIDLSGFMLKTDTAINSEKLGGKDPDYYLSPWLIGTTDEITPAQVYQALVNERNVMITYPNTMFGPVTFTGFGVVGDLDIVLATEVMNFEGEIGQCQLVGAISLNMWHLQITGLASYEQVINLTAEDLGAAPWNHTHLPSTVGAAPAGYGLGNNEGKWATDLNEARKAGWYATSIDTLNQPSLIKYGTVLVMPREASSLAQIAIDTSSGVMAKRICINNSFKEWEYINVAKTHTVTVNSSFVNSGSITAESVGGVLKIGGYLETKKQHTGDGSTTNIICTIPGVKVNGNTYAVMIDHDHSAKAYNILLFTNSSGNTVVQLEPSSTSIASYTWLNFGIVGIIE